MRTKNIWLLSVFFVFLISLTSVNAASSVSSNGFELKIVNDLPATVDAGSSYSVKVNFNNTNSTYSSVNVTLSGSDFSGLVTNDNVVSLSNKDYSLSLSVPSSAINSFSRTLTAKVYNGSDLIETLSVDFSASVNEKSFCEDLGMNDSGDLKITDFDINNKGVGKDDEWELLDDIEITVVVENTDNNDKVRDVFVELKIIDENGDDVTRDFDLEDDKIDLGDIRDRREETATFIIPEVPVDMPEGNYRIYVVAYSDRDSSQCVSYGNDLDNFGSSKYYAEFEIVREYDSGIIVKVPETKVQAECGQKNVEVELSLYNIGDDKEEKVLVNIYNSELGVDEYQVIDNFRSGKKKTVYFNFDIPNNLTKNFYSLKVITYYDWDDREDEDDINSYDENSEDDLDEIYSVKLEVVGGCENNDADLVVSSAPIISAELVSDEVLVGKEVVVRSEILNSGDKPVDFVVSVDGYSSWAELVAPVQPSVISLAPGQSIPVTIRFKPTASGVQTFTIKLINSDQEFSQDVSLNVEEQKGFSFDLGSFGSDNDQLMYWIAIALVVLIIFLIILILIVAFRR